ncbi:hypothetical protein OIO90_004003 [Microbotryomycetes sp. JL221]|nr:hypothetical protein OIO90_004003 [Microbotryomycetes sp. JL221]
MKHALNMSDAASRLLKVSSTLSSSIALGTKQGAYQAAQQLDDILLDAQQSRLSMHARAQELASMARNQLLDAYRNDSNDPEHILKPLAMIIKAASATPKTPLTVLPTEVIQRIIHHVLDVQSFDEDFELRQSTLMSLVRVSKTIRSWVKPIQKREVHLTTMEQYKKLFLQMTQNQLTFPTPLELVTFKLNLLDSMVNPDYTNKDHLWPFVHPIMKRLIGKTRSVHLQISGSNLEDQEPELATTDARYHDELTATEGVHTLESIHLQFDSDSPEIQDYLYGSLLHAGDNVKSIFASADSKNRHHELFGRIEEYIQMDDTAERNPRQWR